MAKQSFKDSPHKPAPPGHLADQDGAAPSSSSDGPSGKGRASARPAYFKCGCAWNDDRYVMLNPEVEIGPTVVPRPPNPDCPACRGTGRLREKRPDANVHEAIAPDQGWEDVVLERVALSKPAYVRARLRDRYDAVLDDVGRKVVAWWQPDLRLARAGFQHPHRRVHARARARMRREIRDETIIHLHVQGHSQRDIAAIMDVRKSTVGDVVARFRADQHPRGEEQKMDTAQAPTIVERLTALEADYTRHKAEVCRQLGLPVEDAAQMSEIIEAFIVSATEPGD